MYNLPMLEPSVRRDHSNFHAGDDKFGDTIVDMVRLSAENIPAYFYTNILFNRTHNYFIVQICQRHSLTIFMRFLNKTLDVTGYKLQSKQNTLGKTKSAPPCHATFDGHVSSLRDDKTTVL